MRIRFEQGASVRVVRSLRNDGTYPGLARGSLLVRRGSVGHVRDMGLFLQDQVIYTVHFLDSGRLVGCREAELQAADAPWVESRFEARERVRARLDLSLQGEVAVRGGAEGEVLRVLRDDPGAIACHVLFGARVLQVPESALEPAGEAFP
jgi:nitrogen fixation protein NifZ